MTETEALETWLATFNTTDKAQQLMIVKDLLAHASGDGMSLEDRAICKKAIRLLESQT